ncbi:MAG: hypothetical protein JWP87_3605 [Labilithrix sp.]|nr:hypothetical protein [Labilithrix sp.]
MSAAMRNTMLRWTLLVTMLSAGVVAACGDGGRESLLDDGTSPAAHGNPAADDPGTTSDGTSGATPSGGNDTTPSTTSGGTSGTASDGGTAPADAAASDSGASPPANDPFAGAAAFVSQSGGSGKHNAGKDCMNGCHNHGFTFAGTLYDAAGNAVPNAEVRLVDANGKAILVHSGNNGNFYSSASWKAPAKVGARTAANKVVMVTALTTAANGGCNGCHATGGTVAKIHVP